MKTLLWIFFISQGFVIYILIGFLVNYIDSLIDHYNWKEDYRKDPKTTITLLFMWPFYIIICMIVAPFRFIKWVLDKLTEEKVKYEIKEEKEKTDLVMSRAYHQVCPYCHSYFIFLEDDIQINKSYDDNLTEVKYIECPSCNFDILMKGDLFNV